MAGNPSIIYPASADNPVRRTIPKGKLPMLQRTRFHLYGHLLLVLGVALLAGCQMDAADADLPAVRLAPPSVAAAPSPVPVAAAPIPVLPAPVPAAGRYTPPPPASAGVPAAWIPDRKSVV